MGPEKLSEWREHLPSPFDKPASPLRRRESTDMLTTIINSFDVLTLSDKSSNRKRRHSGPDTAEQADRHANWFRFLNREHTANGKGKIESALRKLRRLKHATSTRPTLSTPDSREARASDTKPVTRSKAAHAALEHPSRDELLALTYQCFPPIEDARVFITEYSTEFLRTREYTFGEVLASDLILQPENITPCNRWIFVEYDQFGTFWGSDHRFSQWGIIPTLFEKSPVAILRKRLEELDRRAGRSPPPEDPYYKRIGKYYRKRPGSPNFIGLRVNASAWINSEPYKLLLDYLEPRPALRKSLQRSEHNCLEQGIGFINAVDCIREMAYDEKPGLRELHKLADMNDVYFYGNWDDAVERLEFYGENTLLTCGCPRLYKTLADRLLREEDVLRENPDIALLYYALVRVSVENDQMMHDTPERALNKVFVGLKNTRDASRQHVELLFSLRQAVLDGLEYLEENVREFPIYGIPPFDNHQAPFHPDHTPSPKMRSLIQHEIDLIDKDFSTIIGHWRSLRGKVERHLDVLLQLRVLEQQELAVSQSHLATKQQALAIDEARSSRVQSRSVIIFTAITTIFVPLSFFTSYFGMNVTDIVATSHSSGYFWMISIPVTIAILGVIFAILRVLRFDQGPEGDEEKGVGHYGRAESGPPWRLRWGQIRSKLKRS